MYIVFPIECLNSKSGLMVGTIHECGEILCVLDVVTPSMSKKIVNVSVLGLWRGLNSVSLEEKMQDYHSKLVLQSQGRHAPAVFSTEDNEVVVVLYNRQQNMHSYFTTTPLTLRESTLTFDCNANQRKALLPLPSLTQESHTQTILKHINESKEIRIRALLHPYKHAFAAFLYVILSYILVLPTAVLDVMFLISNTFLSGSKLGIFQWRVSYFLTSLPVFLIQCSHRLTQIQFAGKTTEHQQHSLPVNDGQDPFLTKKPFGKLHKKQRILIIKGNILLSIILDVLLGVTIVYLISSSTLIEDIVNNLVYYTDYVAQLLTQLINWLMGVPGGLKLNKTLTNFLGKFFLYHIYLWQTYLQVIQPYLQPVLLVCLMSGCLGMSFLISMSSDVFSILTLHIYFFYVYAARLYSLQIYTISSLARLFTGMSQ